MLSSLLLSAFLMGLAGIPHCAAMCAAPCALAAPQGLAGWTLAGRTLGYALLGALATTAVGFVVAWSRWAAFLQPLWIMALAAVLISALWVVRTGVLPQWLATLGNRSWRLLQSRTQALETASPGHPLARLLRGMAWAALPCGLIYGAVVVAALAETPLGGAMVMAVFSLPGALVLHLLPPRLRLDGAGRLSPEASPAPRASWRAWLADPRWALRLAAVLLAAMTGLALWHRMVAQWQAWCA